MADVHKRAHKVTDYFEQQFGEPFIVPPYERDPRNLDDFTWDTECGMECFKAIDAFKAAYWYSRNAGDSGELIECCRKACMVLIYG